jgi:hypothetical protein
MGNTYSGKIIIFNNTLGEVAVFRSHVLCVINVFWYVVLHCKHLLLDNIWIRNLF